MVGVQWLHRPLAVSTGRLRWTAAVPCVFGENKKVEGVVLQTKGSTCAAATLANIISLYGHDKSEKEMAFESLIFTLEQRILNLLKMDLNHTNQKDFHKALIDNRYRFSVKLRFPIIFM